METRKPKSFDLDKKFVTYALAGSALLGAPVLTQAQTVSIGGTQSLDFSFDNTIADFTLHANYTNETGVPEIYVTGPLTTSFLGTLASFGGSAYPYPTAFPSVAAVNPSVGTISGGNLLKASPGNGGIKGFWPNGSGDAWLGVEFQRSGQQYLGWADIAAAVNRGSGPGQGTGSATILSSGFEVATPEPSSLALMALGAAGLAFLRKRRNAQ